MNIAGALEEIGHLLSGVQPSGYAPALGVYEFPADVDEIVQLTQTGGFEAFPRGIVSQSPNVLNQIVRRATNAYSCYWEAEIVVLLRAGRVDRATDLAAVEAEGQAWATAFLADLLANPSLTGLVLYVGRPADPSPVFEWQCQHLLWENKIYFGVRFIVPIIQEFTN